MKASEALINANEIIQSRGAIYGHPRINQNRIALRFSSLFEQKVTDAQAALAMVEVKLSRIQETPSHVDSYLDGICYLAIALQLQTEEDEFYV